MARTVSPSASWSGSTWLRYPSILPFSSGGTFSGGVSGVFGGRPRSSSRVRVMAGSLKVSSTHSMNSLNP